MNKKNSPTIVKLGILTVITTFIWIGFEVYRALSTEPEPIVSEETLAKVEPNLDTNEMDSLQQRIYINEENIAPINIVSNTQTSQEEQEENAVESEEATNSAQEQIEESANE